MRSFGYAFEGLATIFRLTPNFWIHVCAAILALVLSVLLRLPPGEIAVVVVAIGVVLIAEAFNTALETMCDLVSPTYHPLVKRVKDVAAAAVLLAAIVAVGVAALLFVPRLI